LEISTKKGKEDSPKFDGLFIDLMDVDDINNCETINETKVSDSIERLINMAAPLSQSVVLRERSFDHDDDDFISIPSPLSTSSTDTFPVSNNREEVEIYEDNEDKHVSLPVVLQVETPSYLSPINNLLPDRESSLAITFPLFETISDNKRKLKEKGNKLNSVERHSNMVVSIPTPIMAPPRDFSQLDADPEAEFIWPLMPESPSTARRNSLEVSPNRSLSIPLTSEVYIYIYIIRLMIQMMAFSLLSLL
jgi:hypothetical protein